MGLLSLKTELRQELKLTPQMMQSMELLQMNSQELLEYLNRVMEENPVLEQDDVAGLRSDYEALRQKVSWIDGGVSGAVSSQETPAREPGQWDQDTESLTSFLRDQLERRRLPKALLALTEYLSELLDEDGFLTEEDLEGLKELKIPEPLIGQALETLQSLEPAGVGARSISECLLLQLERSGEDAFGVREIVSDFLPELGRKHYGVIARELGLSTADVQAAERIIAALNPHPGQAFSPPEPTIFVRPDLFIAEVDGQWSVILNEYYLPRIYVSDYYARLLRESEEKETREYLRSKLRQANWVMHCLSQRGGTLRRCAEAILEIQKPFFEGTTQELVPLGLSAMAELLQLHPSTISRATHGKYLQCRQGTYPLRYFFSRAVGNGNSRQAVQQRLLQLVKNEDPRHPLSDQKLCDLLAEDRVEIARRTVAKYRAELGIGSSSERRREVR